MLKMSSLSLNKFVREEFPIEGTIMDDFQVPQPDVVDVSSVEVVRDESSVDDFSDSDRVPPPGDVEPRPMCLSVVPVVRGLYDLPPAADELYSTGYVMGESSCSEGVRVRLDDWVESVRDQLESFVLSGSVFFSAERMADMCRAISAKDYLPAVVASTHIAPDDMDRSYPAPLEQMVAALKEAERARTVLNYRRCLEVANKPSDGLSVALRNHYEPDSLLGGIGRIYSAAEALWGASPAPFFVPEVGCADDESDFVAEGDVSIPATVCRHVYETYGSTRPRRVTIGRVLDEVVDTMTNYGQLMRERRVDLQRRLYGSDDSQLYLRLMMASTMAIFKMRMIPSENFLAMLGMEIANLLMLVHPHVKHSDVVEQMREWLDYVVSETKGGLAEVYRVVTSSLPSVPMSTGDTMNAEISAKEMAEKLSETFVSGSLGNVVIFKILSGVAVMAAFWGCSDSATFFTNAKQVVSAHATKLNEVSTVGKIVVETCTMILETVPEAWRLRSIAPFFSQHSNGKIIQDATKLVALVPRVSIGGWSKEEHGFSCLQDYMAGVKKMITVFETQLSKKSGQPDNVAPYRNLYDQLLRAVDVCRLKIAGTHARVFPYGLMLCGPPGQGKTTLSRVIMPHLCADGIETEYLVGAGKSESDRDSARHVISTTHIAKLNLADKFDSSVDGDVIGIHMDDIGNSKVSDGGSPHANTCDRIIKINNNDPCDILRAEVESKGKIFIAPKIVMGTTNFENGAFASGSFEPNAVLRRFQYFMVTVKKDLVPIICDQGTNAIDAYKLSLAIKSGLVSRDSTGMLDIYDIVERRHDMQGKRVVAVEGAVPMNYKAFLELVTFRARAHLRAEEEKLLDGKGARKTKDDTICSTQYFPSIDVIPLAEVDARVLSSFDKWLISTPLLDTIVDAVGRRLILPHCAAVRLSGLACDTTFFASLRVTACMLVVLGLAVVALPLPYAIFSLLLWGLVFSCAYLIIVVRLMSLRASIASDYLATRSWIERSTSVAIIALLGYSVYRLVGYVRSSFALGSLVAQNDPTSVGIFGRLAQALPPSPFQQFRSASTTQHKPTSVPGDVLPHLALAMGRIKQVGADGTGVQVFRICGGGLMVNYHIMFGARSKVWEKDMPVEVVLPDECVPGKRKTFTLTLHLEGPHKNAHRIDDTDVMIVCTTLAGRGRDFVGLFPNTLGDMVLPSDVAFVSGHLLRCEDPGIVDPQQIQVMAQRAHKFAVAPGEVIQLPEFTLAYELLSGKTSAAGWCGAPILVQHGNNARLLGIHCAGGTVNGSRTSLGTMICCEQLNRAFDLLANTGAVLLPSPVVAEGGFVMRQNGVVEVADRELHKSAAVRKAGGESLVVGVRKFRAGVNPAKTPVKPSIFKEKAWKFGLIDDHKDTHAPPPHCRAVPGELEAETEARLSDLGWGYCKKSVPYESYVEKAIADRPIFDTDMLEWAVDDYTAQIRKALEMEPRSRFAPLSDYEMVNGRYETDPEGRAVDLYIPPLDMTTSTGTPTSTAKKNLATYTPAEKWKFEEKYFEKIKEEMARVSYGEHPGFVFQAALKQEPVKVEKSKSRVFQVAPLPFSLLVRKHFLPIVAAFSRNRLATEVSVGLDATSHDWHALVTHMVKDTCGSICADFSDYDLIVRTQVTSAVFKILIALLQEFDPTADPKLLSAIATGIIMPLIDVDSTIIVVEGTNPSGQPLTSFLNSMVNALFHRMGYYYLHKQKFGRPPDVPFSTVCKATFYGDDVWLAIVQAIRGWYNHTTLQSFFNKHGMTYTLPDKSEQTVDVYEDVTRVEFLKRNPEVMVSPTLGAYYVGKLSASSIQKSLCCTVASKQVSEYDQAVSIAISTLTNRIHWPIEFERLQKLFIEGLQEFGATLSPPAGELPRVLLAPHAEWLAAWTAKYVANRDGGSVDLGEFADILVPDAEAPPPYEDDWQLDDGEAFFAEADEAGDRREAARDTMIQGDDSSSVRPVFTPRPVDFHPDAVLYRPVRMGTATFGATAAPLIIDPYSTWYGVNHGVLSPFIGGRMDFIVDVLVQGSPEAAALFVMGALPVRSIQPGQFSQALRHRVLFPSQTRMSFEIPFLSKNQFWRFGFDTENPGSPDLAIGVHREAQGGDIAEDISVEVYARAVNIELYGYTADSFSAEADCGDVFVRQQVVAGSNREDLGMGSSRPAPLPERVPGEMTSSAIAAIPTLFTAVVTSSMTTVTSPSAVVPITPHMPSFVSSSSVLLDNIRAIDSTGTDLPAVKARRMFFTPAGMLAAPYMYWRGKCRLRFYVVGSAFLRGTVQFQYVAESVDVGGLDVSRGMTVVINLAEKRYVDMEIPWSRSAFCADSPFSEVTNIVLGVGVSGSIAPPNYTVPAMSSRLERIPKMLDHSELGSASYFHDYCNGFVTVMFRTGLSSSVVDERVTVCADISWHELELFSPTGGLPPLGIYFTPPAAQRLVGDGDSEFLAEMDALARPDRTVMSDGIGYVRPVGVVGASPKDSVLAIGDRPLPFFPVSWPVADSDANRFKCPTYSLVATNRYVCMGAVTPPAPPAVPVVYMMSFPLSWVEVYASSYLGTSGGMEVFGTLWFNTAASNATSFPAYYRAEGRHSPGNDVRMVQSTDVARVKHIVTSQVCLNPGTFGVLYPVSGRFFSARFNWNSPRTYAYTQRLGLTTTPSDDAQALFDSVVGFLPFTAYASSSVFIRPAEDFALRWFCSGSIVWVICPQSDP